MTKHDYGNTQVRHWRVPKSLELNLTKCLIYYTISKVVCFVFRTSDIIKPIDKIVVEVGESFIIPTPSPAGNLLPQRWHDQNGGIYNFNEPYISNEAGTKVLTLESIEINFIGKINIGGSV